MSSTVLNRLVPTAPGSTVTWFKKKTFDYVETYDPETEIIAYLTFHLDVYAYICNARPDETFEDEGGELVVIIVQRGSIANQGRTKLTQVTMPISVVGMKSIYVSPKDQPDASGDLHKYSIEFDETKVMFKDQGNTTFEASLAYRDECIRNRHRQYVDARHTVENWSLEVNKSNNPSSEPIPDADPIPFFGLSIFSSTTNLPSLSISHEISVKYRIGKPLGVLARDKAKMDLNFTYTPPEEA